jgi:hypothetical protein
VGTTPCPDDPEEAENWDYNDNYAQVLISQQYCIHRDGPHRVVQNCTSHVGQPQSCLVKKPIDAMPISNKWVFLKKRNKEGELVKYKARLVAKGCTQ